MYARRTFLSATLSTACGTGLLKCISLAHGKTVSYDVTLIRNHVCSVKVRGGTVGLVIADDGVVIVDCGSTPESAIPLVEQIEQRTLRRIDLVINTHHHSTHTGGNIAFKGKAVMLLAHENSKRNQIAAYEKEGMWARLTRGVAQYYPDVTFAKEWSSRIGPEIVTINHWGPAHTDGDATVHFQNSNVVHCGDLLYNRAFPMVDKKAGASFHNWIQVLGRIRRTYDGDTRFICGHAPDGFERVCRLSDVVAFEDFMLRTLDVVKSAIKSGNRREQILNIRAIPGADDWQGEILSSSLAAAYQELIGI